MTLAEYIKSLSPDEREDYARRCGTTPAYLRIHILPARKEPRRQLREALARESQGHVTLEAVLEHFGMIGATTQKQTNHREAPHV